MEGGGSFYSPHQYRKNVGFLVGSRSSHWSILVAGLWSSESFL